MKIALTIWEGWISPVFDVCQLALVLELEHGTVVSGVEAPLGDTTPREKADLLTGLGVQEVICGAISEDAKRELKRRAVKVTAFTAGEVGVVLEAFIQGRLPTPQLSMPGCHGQVNT